MISSPSSLATGTECKTAKAEGSFGRAGGPPHHKSLPRGPPPRDARVKERREDLHRQEDIRK
eukprot:12904874-Prorocentrum_lima.AAC.1